MLCAVSCGSGLVCLHRLHVQSDFVEWSSAHCKLSSHFASVNRCLLWLNMGYEPISNAITWLVFARAKHGVRTQRHIHLSDFVIIALQPWTMTRMYRISDMWIVERSVCTSCDNSVHIQYPAWIGPVINLINLMHSFITFMFMSLNDSQHDAVAAHARSNALR